MARYFFGNTLASFFRSSSSVVESTTAGRFDSAYVPNAILVPSASDYIQTMPFIGVASTTDGWVHFEAYLGGISNAASNFVEFRNSSGTVVAKIVPSSSTNVKFQYWNGSAFVDLGSSWAPTANTVQRWDIHITAGASGTIDVYIGGSSVLSASGMNAAVTNFATVRLYHPSSSSTSFFSQILGASFDTRDSRYALDQPTAIVALTDGSGAIGDVTETVLDESTSWALTAAGQRRGATHATFTPPSGYQIGAVCLSARGRINGTGPTDAKLGLRKITAGVNYSSSALALNGGFEPRGAVWESDPGTASDWTPSGYNDAQMFLEAA